MNDQLRQFSTLSDSELVTQIQALAVRQRHAIAALIACLAEFDARDLYAAEGYPSLFSYCTEHLHLSEHAAFNRIAAARAARRFPVVLEMLAAGDITMTTVTLLSPVLTEENHRSLLEAARHKSKREVMAQMAGRSPLPDVPSLVIPLGNDRFRLQVMLTAESHRILQRLQDLMRHTIPSGDPAEIVERALTALLAQVEHERLAAVRRPRRAREGVAGSRHVPADVRREVWKRDGGRCTFVGPHGRCPGRSFLELHHIIPFARGGPTTVDNVQLRCRAHNVYELAQETKRNEAG
jgi:hypothetical protein